ncbi:MAG TPA: hypothetical protein VGH37_07145 [Candidatus Acidoferrum sp.]
MRSCSYRVLPAILLAGVMTVFAGTSTARPEPGPTPMPQKKMVTVPAGTTILVRMLDTVDSSKNPPGSRFTATLETNLVVGDKVVVPKGNTVYGRLAEAKQAGRATGSSELQLELTDIVVGGTAYPILTSDYEVKGSSSGKRSAKRLLGGAGLGAVIGGIAGNAGMGAAIGATAGAVGSVAQKGKSVNVPSETLLEFRLQQPASLPRR